MDCNNKVRLTVFTPAYNRANTLPRTYESLLNQDNKSFIWLIIDDGSTDNTAELVKSWQQIDNGFEIRYIYKTNGGMHTAHNVAYRNIDTELNICIDSDDALETGAVQRILDKWDSVDKNKYAGIIGLDVNMMTGMVIGKQFDDNLTETTLSGYYSSGGSGDKKLVYRTDVVNEFPEYPEFEGEKLVPLSYKYLMIDQKYKLVVLNESLCRVEYLDSGSSKNIFSQYFKSPKGFAAFRLLQMRYHHGFQLVKTCINYCSSSMIAKNKKYISESPKKFLTFICVPFGALLTFYLKRKIKNK